MSFNNILMIDPRLSEYIRKKTYYVKNHIHGLRICNDVFTLPPNIIKCNCCLNKVKKELAESHGVSLEDYEQELENNRDLQREYDSAIYDRANIYAEDYEPFRITIRRVL